ncbi:MAG: zf-HC2 domain-containing protein [Planctomycetes bacterium]|nr:zf-HC2 domain-containing protein [Planctomycetota bacterium]
MTCGEAREFLFAFLDNELDAPLSIELQLHLEGCPDCAREAEIERAIHTHLAGSLEGMAGPVPVFEVHAVGDDAQILGDIRGAANATRSTISIHRRRLIGAAALVVILLGFGIWYRGGGFGAPGTPQLAEWVVSDFEHFIDQGAYVQLASADATEVADWLSRETALAVTLPTSADPQCKLIGARKCDLEGRPVAFAVYEMHGTLAAVAALASTGEYLKQMEEKRHDGDRYWVDRRRGHTVVACRRGELVYAAVSTLPEEELICLMTGSAHEGD